MIAVFYFPGLDPDLEEKPFSGIAEAIDYAKSRCEAGGTKKFDLLWGRTMYAYFFHGHWYRNKNGRKSH